MKMCSVYTIRRLISGTVLILCMTNTTYIQQINIKHSKAEVK